MGPAAHVPVRNLVELREREDLEAPAVRQNGPLPAHEAVKPPRLGDELGPGPKVEVVGIAQDDPGPDLLEIGRAHV